MEVLSKVKKVEDSNFFNQHLSNVMIEDVSEVLSTVVKKEEGDFFNQHLSSALIENATEILSTVIKNDEEGDFFNQSLSSAYIEDVDLDSSMNTISKEENGNFFNLNLSSAYIEDVDLDASFDTITKVEKFDYNSFIDSKLSEFEELFESENNKYYKIIITKEKRSNYDGSTLANGSFEWLKYAGRRTLNYTSNMTTEDIYFEDINGNEIECTCSYLSGRWSDNSVRDYAPSSFFATSAEESWVSSKSSTTYSEIVSSSGSELKYQILFKTKIPLEYINGLIFDNGRDSGRNVSVVVYSSDDLETFTELMEENLPSGNSYTFSLENAQMWNGYKIVLTATETVNLHTAHLSTASFENLEYDTCLSPRSATATSETIVFTDGENYYNCKISVSSRWNDNGRDDYAPHNLFAPAEKRVSPLPLINATTHEILVCTLKFTDDVSLDLIDNLTLYAGWNVSGYNDRYDKKVKYELYDNDNTLLYEETKTNETNSGDYAMTFSHGLSSSSSNSSNVSD